MGQVTPVMIRCSQTGEPLQTGIVMSAEVFAVSTLTNNTVRCPHCAQPHTWSKNDAWVDEPPAPRTSN
jgi:hypothetical protein